MNSYPTKLLTAVCAFVLQMNDCGAATVTWSGLGVVPNWNCETCLELDPIVKPGDFVSIKATFDLNDPIVLSETAFWKRYSTNDFQGAIGALLLTPANSSAVLTVSSHSLRLRIFDITEQPIPGTVIDTTAWQIESFSPIFTTFEIPTIVPAFERGLFDADVPLNTVVGFSFISVTANVATVPLPPAVLVGALPIACSLFRRRRCE
jgi:hypothetical protein